MRLVFPILVRVGSLWLLVALVFKGLLDRSFLFCLFGSWCFLHLLWLMLREKKY